MFSALHPMRLLRYLRALCDCAVPVAYLTRCHFAAGGFRHLVSKRAWGLLAFEGATLPFAALCLRCALGAEQERSASELSAQLMTCLHIQGSPAWTAA